MRDLCWQLEVKLVSWAVVALSLVVATASQAVTQDITSQFVIMRSGLVLNRTTNTFDSTITLRNTSNAPVLAPIAVVVSGLPGTVTLTNRTGQTPDGKSYFSPLLAGSMLQSGGTLSFVLKFANPQRVTITSILQILYTIEVPPDAPSLLGVLATGGTNARVIGRVDGAVSLPIVVQASSAATCVAGTLVNGAPTDGPKAVTTDPEGYFSVDVAGVNPGAFVTVKLTSPQASPGSLCQVSSRDNDSWPKAFLLEGSTLTARDFIDSPGKARWYKFSVTPGQRIDIALTGLPADYDLAVFKDIGQTFAKQFTPGTTARTSDLLKLTAEYAPSTFSPSTFSPSTFSPDAYAPSTFSPSTFSPSTFSPSTFSPSTFSPSTFSPSTFSPSTFSPSTFSPSTFSPSTFSPSLYTATEIAQAFSTAQTRSVVAVAATPGAGNESTVVNTFNNTGTYYVRVTGRNGAFNTSTAFNLSVTKGLTTCDRVTDTTLTSRTAEAASGLKTVFLTDSSRVALDAALPGPGGGTLRTKLAAFAARPDIKGVVVDVAGDARVPTLKTQAANNPACPFAKNLVAEELKGIVDSYRANPLQYVVLVGNDDAIPFFRSPDQSGIGQESGYVPPVESNSASEASLRKDFVLSQDGYGSKTRISLPSNDFPVPGLAVGRLIETATEIAGIIDAYVAADGVVAPGSSLVTGYDFLEDAAIAVRKELECGTGASADTSICGSGALGTGAVADTLITPNNLSPQASDPRVWTAADLGAKLLGTRHDVIFLAGHFSANSALAADFTTSLLTTDLAASTVNLTNAIIFSAGCHAGYNLVDGDAILGVTLPLDWAQAFAQKGATLIAGTGYQYGDTDFLEYSERLYKNFARQLRVGTAGEPVAVGEALVKAKLAYLATIPDIRGIHEKALLEATLFGLPMLGVNMPSGRAAVAGTDGAIVPDPVTGTGPAASLGLKIKDLTLTPSLTSNTMSLKNIRAPPDFVDATWLSGPDGVVTKPGEPALPLVTVDVTPSDPNIVLRGVGFRGGRFADSAPILPFSGAPTTELRGVHVPFVSPVFFPGRLFSINYFGALAEVGGTQLLVTPAQHRVASLANATSTQRRFNGLDLRLYYSGDLSQAALSDAPTIVGVETRPETVGGGMLFTAQVTGDPKAAIHQVWITYTGDGVNSWAPLDLSQCVAPLPALCASEDSRLWMGRLPSAPTNLKHFVQAVNGVGLVAVDDNLGAYYGVASATPVATTLATITPPTGAAIGDSVNITAKLSYAGGPVVGKTVVVSVGGVSQIGTTGSDGSVTVKVPTAAVAGTYQITASFAGDDSVLPSSTTTSFVLSKPVPRLEALAPPAIGVALTGVVGGTIAALQQEDVAFLVNGPGGARTIWVTTDNLGRATLPPPGLPPGTYTVTKAAFAEALFPGAPFFVDATYAGASVLLNQSFAVAKNPQGITFDPSFDTLVSKAFGDPDFAIYATASSGLPVSFAASGACTVLGSTVHITGVGSCTITADQAGDSNYSAATASHTFSIVVLDPPPTVVSLVRAVTSPTMADTVTYTLTLSEPVTGVTPSNFAVVAGGGVAASSVATVSGAGTTWTVTVNTGRGTGSLRLDVVNGTGITDAASNVLAGTPFTGETYQIDKGGTVIGTGAGQPVAGFGSAGYSLFSEVPLVSAPSPAVLADGRILAAGGIGCTLQTPSDPNSPIYCALQLARFSATGAPDALFGTNGRVLTLVTSISPELSALIVNADGTFFVTGSRYNGTADVPFVAKFTSAGAPVTGFGTNGLASLDSLPLGLGIVGSAIDGSGRIVIASTTPNVPPEGNDIFVTRLTATGAIDPTFAPLPTPGVARFPISTTGTKSDRGTAVAVQPDGFIVVGGRTEGSSGSGFDFLLLRLDANGALDPNFGVGGIATTRFPSTGGNFGRKLVLQPDGKIVLVGGVNVGAIDSQCGVARFKANGTLDDANFGSGGQVLDPVTGGCFDVSRQTDGKLVIVANDHDGDVQYGTFIRLLPTGAPDAGFGNGGLLDISGFGTPARVAFTAGGNLVTGFVIQDPADGVLKSYVVELSSVPAANQPPVANAGPDQTVTAGATVQLTSAGSYDPEGNPLGYSWTLTSKPVGSAAAFNNSSLANPTFIADKKGTYGAQLIVNDGGSPPLDSAPDTVQVTAANRAPVAVADPNYVVGRNGGLVVHPGVGVLSNDSDPDGDALTAVRVDNVLHGALTLNPDGGFTYTPSLGYVGPDSFTYRANDGATDSNVATVSLTVILENNPPVANAGSDQNATVGQLVQLNGACTDVDNDSTTPAWSFTARPVGSIAVLSSTTILSPTFTPDLPGSYQLQLICNDGHVDSSPSPVAIVVASPTITLTLASPLTGVGQAVGGTIALGSAAPAGGLQVTLASSSSGVATVAPSPVTISAGSSTGAFTVTGVALGTATITGTAAGYSNGTVDIDVTGSVIAVGNVTTVPGQTQAFPVTLATPAPAGGVTVSLSSGNTGVVTVPASVFVAAGATAPVANPVATGVAPGSATITASTVGYAPGTATATIIAVPTQLTVTNTNDIGAGSLRDVIALANLASDPNSIDFAPGVTGTITLTTGQIRIDNPLTIVGPGASNLTIDGNLNGRIFTIIENNAPACPALSGPSDFLVSISGLTLRNGSRNVADSSGGAIQTSKSLVLDDVTIRDSQAKSGGGLAFNAQYAGQSLTITNSRFIDNVAKPVVAGDTGGHIGGALRIGNYCGGVDVPVTVTIGTSVFAGNRVQPVDLPGSGGAIHVNDKASVTISDTRIVDNHAEPNTQVGTGHTSVGGGIQAVTRGSSLTIERSEIADNSAQFIGGLSINAPDPSLQAPASAYVFRLINSTVSGNTGGIALYANVSAEISNSTVADNVGPGIHYRKNSAAEATPTLKLVSSIVAGSRNGSWDVIGDVTHIPSFTIDATNSLVQRVCETCSITLSGAGNLPVGYVPQLGPLADHGGLTRTHALLTDSAAHNAGSNPLGLTTDQRGAGFPRVLDTTPDVGAFEGVVDRAPFAYFVGAGGNLLVVDTATNTYIAEIAVGANPYAAVVNPAGSRVYVSNFGSNSVSVVDVANKSVVATVPVGAGPQGLAVGPSGSRVYVASFNAGTVSVIDAGTNAVVASIPIAGAADVAVNRAGTRLYVAGGSGIEVVDTSTNLVVNSVSLGSLSAFGTLAISPDDARLYAWSDGSAAIAVIDVTTNSITNAISIPGPFANNGIAVHPSGAPVYQSSGSTVSLINPASNLVSATVTLGTTASGVNGVALTPDGTRVYVATANGVRTFDTATNTVASLPFGTMDTVPVGSVRALGLFIGPAAAATSTWFSGPAATGTGIAYARFTCTGTTNCLYTRAAWIGQPGSAGAPPVEPAIAGANFPHGLFDFVVAGGNIGFAVTFTLEFPEPLPSATVFYKYGPTAAIPTPHWYQLPATTTGNTVTFSITDGGLGDDDLTANGAIGSMGGPVAFAVASPTITLTLASPLTGVGQAVGGTIALGSAAPAGGLQVTLASSSGGVATVAPSPVTITAGATTGAFTVTGVALGTATITGTAAGYSNGTVDIDVTGSVIAVGNVMTVPGQTQAFPVTLATPAPAGGVTVNLTSGNTGVVTVPASVFIAAGATAPVANPVATGVAPGTATITANAIGYAPGNGSATIIAVPVQITVTNANDSGAGSLRDAIALANLAPDANTIDLQGVTGTIALTTGQIRIDSPLTIVGPGAGNLTIDGNLNGRIFTIIENNAPACPALSGPSDFQVTISGLTLQRGSRNVVDSGGGAIQTSKSLVLDDVTIRDSQAKNGGGLIFNAQYPGQTLTIVNSRFIDNVAKPVVAGDTNSHNGGALLVHDSCHGTRIPAVVNIASSVFTGNRVQPVLLEGRGGAIAAYNNASVTIVDTRIVDNHVEPPIPPAGFAYPGGGMQATTTSVTIIGSEIAGNSADFGGGLSIAADDADLQAPASAFTFRLINSTVSGNTTNRGGGAINFYANVTAELYNSTVADNLPGGIANSKPSGAAYSPPTLKLVSSILGSSRGGIDVGTDVTNIPSFTIDAANSLVQNICPTPTCSITSGSGNLVGVDPQLGPLADYGGLTRTHALLTGSPAIDAGNNDLLALTTDQRGEGFPRALGAAVDMGAYEGFVASVNHPPVANAGPNQNVRTGQLVQLSGACTDADNDTTTGAWSYIAKPSGSNGALSSTTILDPTFTPDVPGSYQLRLICNDGHVDSSPSPVTIAVSNPPITLTLAASQTGIGQSVGGTITLSVAAPAGGLQVALTSSSTGVATVTPSSVAIAAGATTGSFTVTGVGPGAATITGSAPGYSNGSVSIDVPTVNVGLVILAPGQTRDFPVTLATLAPAGGVTVALSSSDTAVVTVPASVFIPAGAIAPVVDPIATGIAPGTATITGTATGYAPGNGSATVAAPVQWTVTSGGNDRWYQFIYHPSGFTWQQAWSAASGSSFLGVPGYLATSTSPAENVFLDSLAKYPAGATGIIFDPANPTVSLGSTSIAGSTASTWLGGADAATEGTWRWVNGPETGSVFWTGDFNGTSPPGAFASWDTGFEPSNSSAGEDFLQLRKSVGIWNDTGSGALQNLPGFNQDGITRTRVPATFIVEYSPATTPVTFTVTNTNDSGVGSLRDAILQANLAPGPNTVDFVPGLTGTIGLTSGQIQISGPLTIVGPGAGNLTIDGNASNRIFSIFVTDPACPAFDGPDYLVSISGLRLTNARRNADNSGGAIFTEHSLTLDSMIIDNSQARAGAGLSVNLQYPAQSLTVTNSQFNNNIAKPLSATTATEIRGGAIAIVERCSNTSTAPVTVTIANSVFAGNRVQPAALHGKGGAILAYTDADITITDTRIVDNGVDIPVSPVAGATYGGGGFYGRAKSLRIERSELAGSVAGLGGALRFFNDVPGLQTPETAMAVTIVNSTISGSVVSETAGALSAHGNVAIELDNTTVSDNTAAAGRTGGLLFTTGATSPPSASNALAGTLKLVSSIIANSQAGPSDLSTNIAVIPSFTVNATNSLIETICPSPSCEISIVGSGNIIGVDPMLGPLAPNGSTTRTHALLPGSPAINTGSNPLGLATDQRGSGFPRVLGGTADMGAHESP